MIDLLAEKVQHVSRTLETKLQSEGWDTDRDQNGFTASKAGSYRIEFKKFQGSKIMMNISCLAALCNPHSDFITSARMALDVFRRYVNNCEGGNGV